MNEKLTADRIGDWCEACRDYLLAYNSVKLSDLRATFSDIFAELNEPEAAALPAKAKDFIKRIGRFMIGKYEYKLACEARDIIAEWDKEPEAAPPAVPDRKANAGLSIESQCRIWHRKYNEERERADKPDSEAIRKGREALDTITLGSEYLENERKFILAALDAAAVGERRIAECLQACYGCLTGTTLTMSDDIVEEFADVFVAFESQQPPTERQLTGDEVIQKGDIIEDNEGNRQNAQGLVGYKASHLVKGVKVFRPTEQAEQIVAWKTLAEHLFEYIRDCASDYASSDNEEQNEYHAFAVKHGYYQKTDVATQIVERHGAKFEQTEQAGSDDKADGGKPDSPAPASDVFDPQRFIVRSFSGKESEELWRLINALGPKEHDAMYEMGCVGQAIEAQVKSLAERLDAHDAARCDDTARSEMLADLERRIAKLEGAKR